ncbi:MAG: hypothetical protein R3F61_37765 [Myxococcota bacterium]
MLAAILTPAFADPCTGFDPCTVVETTKTTGGEVVHVANVKDLEGDWEYPSSPGECTRHAYVWKPTKGPERTIVRLCNDGYGASMVGEDTVTVKDGVIEHSQLGGSAWKWGTRRELQLEPPRLLSEGSQGLFMGMLGSDRSWSWATFSGMLTESFQRCGSEDGTTEDVASVLIPAVAEVPGYAWKTTGLGKCALRIDASTGPFAHGGPGEAGDAGLSAARIGSDLVVEVGDDTWVEKASSWIKADHLEIWVRTESIPSQDCVSKVPAMQWGIGLDGTVFPAHGEPAPLKAEVVRDGAGARFRISGLPAEIDGITVVYSDSDDGERQERLLATSPVKLGHGETLGGLYTVKPEHAVCTVDGAALTVKETRTFPADRPLLEGAD